MLKLGRTVAVGIASSVIVTVLLVGNFAAPAHASDARSVRRVFVFSLPHVSWEDLEKFSDEVPNLNRFLGRAAIAGLTTRADQRSTKLADGYLTLGTGTRTVGDPATDGDALGVDEPFGRDSAGQVFRQRTGREVRHGIVALAMPRVVEANDALLYDAEPGALAVALRDAGIDRAVVANADGRQPDSPPSPSVSSLRRQAALALVDPRGRVPAGRVDESILEADPTAPYGLRLDADATVGAFRREWHDRTVVLVEGSDLVRADAYRPFSTPIHRDIQLRQALRSTDRLFGRLLREVDTVRDAVLVVGPTHPTRAISLTVLGLQGPGIQPGLLRSGTTRRSGFVQLIDVAPTILDLLDVPRPTSMEGRPAEVGATGGSPAERRDLIVHADGAAQFRDRIVGPVQVAFVVLAGMLVAGAILVLGRPRPRRWRVWLGTFGLCVLGFTPAVFLARLVPLHEVGVVAYWTFLVVVAAALGTIYRRIGRHRPLDGLLAAFLVPVGLLLVDVLIGTPLQFNSALGYSPTVAGRFTGFSNPAYAIVAASAVLAAPLIARRIGGRRGAWISVAFLGMVIVVDGVPFWGADVGGILSMVPAFAVTSLLLLGWRVRWKTVAWSVVGLVVAVAGFTALDMARPPERRTHLGRLVERVNDRGIGDLVVVLQRKLGDNLGSLRTSIWGLVLPITLVLVYWLIKRAPARLRAVDAAVPEGRIGGIGLAIVAVLGYALNDSGVAIPGVMLVIAIAAFVWLLVRFEPGDRPDDGERPDEDQDALRAEPPAVESVTTAAARS
ncbi:MAG: hypothetical protein MUP97_03420 [Acidimicrobiia bacterium]|nr:hypothetical protein [Acidimicrobiia bacterium]